MISRTQKPVNVLRAMQEGPWVVTVRDISMEGIGLVASEPFPIDAVLTIELPSRSGSVQRALRVRNVRQNPGRVWWTVGCAFVHTLSPADVTFLQKKSPCIAPLRERRLKVRHTTRLKQPCRVLRMHLEGPWTLSIRDVSETGIGFIARRPFKDGMFLTVELPVQPPRPALLRVVHSRKQLDSNDWTLGCALTQYLSRDDVEKFL
jgi:hypothetical protein